MLLASLASVILPETLGSPLLQTTQEAEQFGTDFPFFYCPKSTGNAIDKAKQTTRQFAVDTESIEELEEANEVEMTPLHANSEKMV